MRIGVIALQGAFIEHIDKFKILGVDAFPVRQTMELEKIDGLVIPGGESTAIRRLMLEYNIISEIRRLGLSGLPIFGTCAGMILMAREISCNNKARPLGLMDITVRRNAFGRQKESFEKDIIVPILGEKSFPAVFIRAPYIEDAGTAEVLSRLNDGKIIAAKQGKLLATAFHPELTDDLRFHQYFIDIINGDS
jgi:5'-phosphate synthase pdxT subunit